MACLQLDPRLCVAEPAPGDHFVATVRRRGGSIYDQIGNYDMTTDDEDYERGINLMHGYLAEASWPGWLSKLLTHLVRGLERYEQLLQALLEAKDGIKIYVIVGEE